MKRGRAAAALLVAAAAACGGSASAPQPSPAAADAAPAGQFPPEFERRIAPFPVLDEDGRAYAYPFLGGLDHPRPQLLDIDADGDLDLFLQEYSGQMAFFEAVADTSRGGAGGAGTRHVWRTDQWHGIDVGEWSRFVDADADGDLDLLAESRYSYIRYFRNDGDAARARLTVAADTLRDAGGTPIFADRQNIPQLADVDCDGALDLLLGRIDGTIARYESRGLDAAGAPRFEVVTERFEDIQIIGEMPSRHGANTMAIADLDGDGDQDILWGDFFEPGLLWLRNGGSCAAPAIRDAPIPFPANAPLRTSGYNAPAVADLNGDRDLDVLVGVLGGAFDPTRTARENLYLLEQSAPGAYEVRTRRYLAGIDVGTESVPALADLDGDGDLDLAIGSKIEPDDPRTGGLYLFENAGTRTAPTFRAAGRIPVAQGHHLAPAFGDLDGDGDADLLLGTWRDVLLLYRNEGGAGAARFVLADSALLRLTRGSHATPALADLDGDGDLDLLVGEASGTVNHYRNDGSRAEPRFVLESEEYLELRAGRRSVPRLADLDGDGDGDLVVGNETGQALLFRNEGTRRAPAFARTPSARLAWPPYAAPAFGDLDGDGDLDALVGNAGGGVAYWEHRGPAASGGATPSAPPSPTR